MLVLTGDVEDKFIVNFGTPEECEILIVGLQDGRIKLGFTAPLSVQIYRGVVADRIRRGGVENGGRNR